MLILTLVAAAALSLQPQPDAKPAAPKTVTIRVLDESGKPAPHVQVGSMASGTDPAAQPHLVLFGEEQLEAPETGEDGLVTINQNAIFYGDDDTVSKPIIAWTKDLAMVGLAELPRPCPAAPLEVKLAPACRVEIKTISEGLDKLGQKLLWSNVYVYWKTLRPMSCDSRTGHHVLFLPPGEYKLNAYGQDAEAVNPPLKIEPGDRTKTMTLDLPASRIAQLTGKPAPELTNIKGWLNGGPVKLADLKGKVVLLDFWGYWCGPCVHSIPELMALHDQYKDKGLVIIAVHDASATDLKDMKAKLERPKKEIWNGRDLPFLVALDGADKPGPGDNPYGSGDTTAAYGITGFPTQVLIDKDGNVVGREWKGRIEQMLGALDHK
jgi:thiol-disulfide isomerase/thioredoxin